MNDDEGVKEWMSLFDFCQAKSPHLQDLNCVTQIYEFLICWLPIIDVEKMDELCIWRRVIGEK